jgi:lysophospholipase L1-like esterase
MTSILAAIIAAAAVACASTAAHDGNPLGAWREAYQSSPADYDFVIPANFTPPKELKISPEMLERMKPRPPITGTLRSRFAVAVAGSQIRVRVSNEENDKPLRITTGSVGLAAGDFDAQPGSIKPLTFGGQRDIVIPAGAPALSDPVQMAVSVGKELVVSLYTPSGLAVKPFGGALLSVADGDQTSNEKLSGSGSIIGRPLVSGVSVLTPTPVRIIVAFGDSITDGNRAKLGELRSWPEELEHRLAARNGGPTLAVIDAGIGGNRVIMGGWGKAAVARFDRDVTRIGGVSHVVVLEGINDIGNAGQSLFGTSPPLETADLIAGYRQLIARAHARGIKLIMGTLLPFSGAMYFSPAKEQQRAAVNRWIRTSGEPDGVIDFDAITRDPAEPARMRADYDSGDHLHPGEAGYRAMGDAIDLKLFD